MRVSRRAVLSTLFIVHWAAVATLVLLEIGTARQTPPPLRRALNQGPLPVMQIIWPGARLWLDATSTHQHWMLFAPEPSDWVATLEAVAWYSGDDHLGEPTVWQTDSLTIGGPAEDPFPHWTRPRSYDTFFSLAYEVSGDFFRRRLALQLCQRLDRDGRRPVKVSLAASWQPVNPPWLKVPRNPRRTSLGSFDCDVAAGAADD